MFNNKTLFFQNKKLLVITLIIIVGILVLTGWAFVASQPKENPLLDQFAKCLTERKVVMYGAYWCPHCKNQKKLFGDSFKFVKYVECTQDAKTCEEQQIKGYPTWTFEDGSRVEGEMSFKQLSEKSSCPVP